MKFAFVYIDRIIALVLFAGLSLLSYNEVANYHIHITEDGKIVSHSHPHSDSNSRSSDANHHHSNIQFVNFDKLGHQFTVSLSISELEHHQKVICENKIAIDFKTHFKVDYLTNNQLRAPPLS